MSTETIRTPQEDEDEVFGVVKSSHGQKRFNVVCTDDEERNCRVPGSAEFWVEEDDLVIVSVWDFQPSRGDIVYKYSDSERDELEVKFEKEN